MYKSKKKEQQNLTHRLTHRSFSCLTVAGDLLEGMTCLNPRFLSAADTRAIKHLQAPHQTAESATDDTDVCFVVVVKSSYAFHPT